MPLLSTRKRRLAVLIATGALVAVGSGLAFAYWTGGGEGSGTATTGSSTSFEVTSVAPVGDPLVPGGAAQEVTFTVANTGAGAQTLSDVEVSVAKADGTAWVAAPGCSSADYLVGTPTITYGDIAGGDSVDGTVTVTMKDRATNQDACQGVTAPLYFLAS